MDENKIIRCAGVVLDENKNVLLIRSNYGGKEYWILPGGGLEFGESLHDCVIREIKEESNIDVTPKSLIFMDENLEKNRHMIHFTYLCTPNSLNVVTGTDPDHEEEIIKEAKFVSLSELKSMDNFIPPVMKDFLIKGIESEFPEKVINFHELK